MKKILLVIIMIWVVVVGVFCCSNLQTYAHEDEISGSIMLPEIYIKAVNPGYSIEGKTNVGEMIEIARREKSDTPISLAGLTISYTNASGNEAVLVEFPEHTWMAGETILLRLASSPERELAALNYAKTLAFKAGPLTLKRNDEVLDVVCWTGKDGCYSEFKSANPTALVRNEEMGEFEHLSEYVPFYDDKSYVVDEVSDEGYGSAGQCKGLIFSELLSYYETSRSEQFIEFYNTMSEQILLDGCQVRYKNKYYRLSGVVGAEGYFVRYLDDFSLTKNPTSSNVIELIDADGTVIDRIDYPNGQRKGTSYAWVGYDAEGKKLWRVTYAPTPGEPNNYQEFKTCEAGKVLNEVTGNCVKVTSVKEKICPAGQYLNVLTGRCRKIPVVNEKITTCKEGYYYNEETGRCRKIVVNDGADYSLPVENYEENTEFIALYAILGVVGVGIIYIVYEFRREIVKLWRKVYQRFR